MKIGKLTSGETWKHEPTAPASALTIGRLAKAAEVNVETIRYYQRTDLMRTPTKLPGEIRCYHHEDLSRLHFIRRAKQLGFSLKDIRALLQLDEKNCDDVRELAEHKLIDVHKRISDLESVAKSLSAMIRQCKSSDQPACPIIDSLTPSGT